MKTKNRFLEPLLLAVLLAFAFYTNTELVAAKLRVDVGAIPSVPVTTAQELMVDVALRQRDIVHVESHWPASFEVTNITRDKNITGVILDIIAANDEGGPGRMVGWGADPAQKKNDRPLLPGRSITINLPEDLIRLFQENGKPFLWVQVASVWVNNDPSVMYSRGLEMRVDPNNPRNYIVAVDDKGRIRDYPNNPSKIIGLAPDAANQAHAHRQSQKKRREKKNHAALSVFPHIIHSAKPPFMLNCCIATY